MISYQELYDLLEEKADLYNRLSFIETDPISIPHLFTRKEDIEISGFLTATIAWGQRKTILKNAEALMKRMDLAPFDFIRNASPKETSALKNFKHRTFNGTDLAFFLQALKNIYSSRGGLEKIFSAKAEMKDAIINFRDAFFSIKHPARTRKHVSNPEENSSAKRINMFLRWMARKDKRGVDFGLWNIPASRLMCPLDVHSGNVARKLGLLKRKQDDWKAVEELTARLRRFDPADPVKYDFALFGLGAFEKF